MQSYQRTTKDESSKEEKSKRKKKEFFSKEEDEQLFNYVQLYGFDWMLIGNKMHKKGKQC